MPIERCPECGLLGAHQPSCSKVAPPPELQPDEHSGWVPVQPGEAAHNIKLGALLLIGGLLFTAFTYFLNVTLLGHGDYLIAVGAIFFGGWRVLLGLFQLFR